jgi:hypothetical protein
MNVDPLPTSLAGIERQTSERKQQAVPSPRTATSESVPKAEINRIQNSPAPSAFPEYEVKVQLDTPIDGVVVYRVLDKQPGALVWQV